MAQTRIKSDLAGVVSKVLVHVGSEVAEDEPLMLMESMKMEIPVTAPRAGTVMQLSASEGEQVSEGDLLVTLSH